MPIYEYRCRECGAVFDAFQSIGADSSGLECPECGALKAEKLFSTFASGAAGASGTAASGSCGPASFG